MSTGVQYAPPAIRDEFLLALDADDRIRSTRLALYLATCDNRLPGITCGELGLPAGSTYAAAAKWVLDRDREMSAARVAMLAQMAKEPL